MSSYDYYYIQILTSIPIYLHQYVVPILYGLANIGNFLSLFIFLKKQWRKNVCVFYFIICLINDTILVNSTILGAMLSLGFNISTQNYNNIVCKLFYYVSYSCSTYLPITLICASIDRLLISSQNVDTRLYSSKRLAYFLVSTSAILWSLFSLHILIKVNIQELYPTYFICYYDMDRLYLYFFSLSSLIISVVVPLTMIIFSIVAFKNVRRIRAIPREKRNQIRPMTKKDFQLLRCLYIHNIVYIICSLLLLVGIIYGTAGFQTGTPVEQALNNFLNGLGSFIHYLPYCTSFFIFISVSKAFRLELKRMIYKLSCQNPAMVIHEEENVQQEPLRTNVDVNVAVSTIALPR